MRDLDRLREVREYRVTGPQLASLALLVLLIAGASFLLGFEVGLWRGPIDEALLAPVGGAGATDAEQALADLLAQRDHRRAAEVPSEDSPQAAGGGGLTVVDDTKPSPSEGSPRPTGGLTAAELRARSSEVEENSGIAEMTPEPYAEPVPTDLREETLATIAEPVPDLPQVEPDGLPRPKTGAKGFTVQLAAYDNIEDARALIRLLREAGHEPFHVEADVDGKIWHRIRVGIFSSREAAEAKAAELAGVGPYTPYVAKQP